MIFAFPRTALAGAGLFLMLSAPALAQRGPTPEQQIYVLQQQLSASQASAIRLEQRLGAIEQQMQQIVNGYETSANRLRLLESALQQLRSEQDNRLGALERARVPAPPAATPPEAVAGRVEPPASAPPEARVATAGPVVPPAAAAAPVDPGEDAYTEGFRHWEAKRYDSAIASLRAFASAFPAHRRVSWANNLIGRALLDKGEPRAAAEVLLANYRTNPRGGRAQDSLYYLGQALMGLNQPDQACKAYAELTSVYGNAVRGELQALVDRARSEASCR
jgi:TolA-binding protein